MPKKMTIETSEVAEDRTYHKETEVKMSIISHWTGLRTALRFLLLACLLPCGVSLGVESPDSIERVDDHTWLVPSGTDTLVAHAVLTLPPYHADPSGEKDSTLAFRKAIDAVGKLGGGLVYVPAGVYKVQGTILLNRDKVVIQGETPRDAAARSTVLLAYQGKGSEEGEPFITISRRSCGLKDLAVFYPEQGRDTFVPYPYTIDSHSSVLLENLTLYNSYNGIFIGHANAILLEDIRMCALKNGIIGKISSEFGWARNIEVSAKVWQELPAFVKATKPDVAAVHSFMRENCTGMELGALDGFTLDGLEAADCKTALWNTKYPDFIKDEKGFGDRRIGDNFGFGTIVSRVKGRIAYTGHDYYYWKMPAINLDNVRGLPELRQKWPSHRRAAKTSSADFFHVKDFGATGDGSTDDTATVLKALKKAASNGGGIVYFPQGSYGITENLTVPPGTELRGACARQVTRLEDTEVTSLLFELDAAGEDVATAPASITLTENAGIRGLNIFFRNSGVISPRKVSIRFPIPMPCEAEGRGCI